MQRPVCFPTLLSWFIKDSKHLGDSLFLALAGFLVAAAGFLLFYHITLLAVLLTGNIVIAGGLLAFFVFYVSVTFGVIVQMYSKMFFQTFYQADWLKRIKLYLLLWIYIRGWPVPGNMGRGQAGGPCVLMPRILRLPRIWQLFCTFWSGYSFTAAPQKRQVKQ